MRRLLVAFVFLLTSVSYGQIPLEELPEISEEDVASGNVEAVREAIRGRAIIDRGTVQHFLDAISKYHQYEVAYVLLDALFNSRVDVANCLFVTQLGDRVVRMPPMESKRYIRAYMGFLFSQHAHFLTDIELVHLRNIERLLLGQNFENLDSCESIDEQPDVGTLLLITNY